MELRLLDRVLHNYSNNTTNQLQNRGTQPAWGTWNAMIILLQYIARIRWSSRNAFECDILHFVEELVPNVSVSPIARVFSNSRVRDRISYNETTVTDRYTCWIMIYGPLNCWCRRRIVRTYDRMLWAKWWPVFTTYYGCGLSWRNKLCACPSSLLCALRILRCCCVDNIYCCDSRFPQFFAAHSFGHNKTSFGRLAIALCATDLNAFWFIFDYNSSTIWMDDDVWCSWNSSPPLKKQPPVAHWVERANRRYSMCRLNINRICRSGHKHELTNARVLFVRFAVGAVARIIIAKSVK